MRPQPLHQDHHDRSKCDRKANKGGQRTNKQKMQDHYHKGFLIHQDQEPLNKTEEQERKAEDNTNQVQSSPRTFRQERRAVDRQW